MIISIFKRKDKLFTFSILHFYFIVIVLFFFLVMFALLGTYFQKNNKKELCIVWVIVQYTEYLKNPVKVNKLQLISVCKEYKLVSINDIHGLLNYI